MILESGLLSEFNRISAAGLGPLTGTPVKWEPSKNKIILSSRTFSIGTVLAFFSATSLLGHVAFAFLSHNADHYLGVTFAIGCGFTIVFSSAFQTAREPEVLRGFFNQIIKLDLDFPHKTNQNPIQLEAGNLVKFAKLACSTIRLSTVTGLPMVALVISLYVPAFPTNVLYYYPGRALIDLEIRLWGNER